jgi:hypothetical protein
MSAETSENMSAARNMRIPMANETSRTVERGAAFFLNIIGKDR